MDRTGAPLRPLEHDRHIPTTTGHPYSCRDSYSVGEMRRPLVLAGVIPSPGLSESALGSRETSETGVSRHHTSALGRIRTYNLLIRRSKVTYICHIPAVTTIPRHCHLPGVSWISE